MQPYLGLSIDATDNSFDDWNLPSMNYLPMCNAGKCDRFPDVLAKAYVSYSCEQLCVLVKTEPGTYLDPSSTPADNWIKVSSCSVFARFCSQYISPSCVKPKDLHHCTQYFACLSSWQYPTYYGRLGQGDRMGGVFQSKARL